MIIVRDGERSEINEWDRQDKVNEDGADEEYDCEHIDMKMTIKIID